MSLIGDKCDESCGENEAPNDKNVCVCDSESIIHEDGTRCIKKSKCQRAIEKDGTTVCLASETCPEGTKLSTDGQLCVSDCDFWTEDTSTKEHQCVISCPVHWSQDASGRCVEDEDNACTNEDNNSKDKNAWLVPAVTVPVALASCAAGIGIGVACERYKRSSAGYSQKSGKKPELKLTSKPGSRMSVRSPAKSHLLEVAAPGSAAYTDSTGVLEEEPTLGSEKREQRSEKAQKKHQLRPKHAIKQTPLLGEEELPATTAQESAKTNTQKRLDDLDAMLWDNALGEAKRIKNPNLQGLGKDVGLTPVKVGGDKPEQ